MKRTLIIVVTFATAIAVLAEVVDAQVVTRGPYLQIGTTDGVTVRWSSEQAFTQGRVSVGTAPDNLTMHFDQLAFVEHHEIAVTGLQPGTKYYYSVGTPAVPMQGGDENHYFFTSPLPGTTPHVRVWAIGDSGLPGVNASNVRNAYLLYPGSADTDVWLMLGDNAYNTGTLPEYEAAVFDMYPTFLRRTVLWPTRGNHDGIHTGPDNDYYELFSMPTSGQSGGVASFTEAYYSFDYANVHFICLDSEGSGNDPSDPMIVWLAADLAATAQDWVIAYWHHPPYSKGSHDSDSTTDSAGRLVEMRENVLPVLEAHGVDLVLGGHSHSYERSFLLDGHYGFSTTLTPAMKIDDGDGDIEGDGAYLKPTLGKAPHEGAVYAVAGSSSRLGGGTFNHPVMVRSLQELGSLVLDISGNVLEGTFIDDTGAVLDEFAIVKGVTASGVDATTPSLVRIGNAMPNPFTDVTQIDYSLTSAGPATITIYDVAGRRVSELVSRDHAAGTHLAVWNGNDALGRPVSAGIYFAVLEAAGDKRTRKIVRVR